MINRKEMARGKLEKCNTLTLHVGIEFGKWRLKVKIREVGILIRSILAKLRIAERW